MCMFPCSSFVVDKQQNTPDASVHPASVEDPGKRTDAPSHHGEPHAWWRQTEVTGGAPLSQQSLMVATTRGTVSTTAIRQV